MAGYFTNGAENLGSMTTRNFLCTSDNSSRGPNQRIASERLGQEVAHTASVSDQQGEG
jgi:hypothetical protein